MPKGHNRDGSKKQRPANSGRKAVPGKVISPKISLEAAAVLATLPNPNKFISEAILEKAAREAEKKASKPIEPSKPASGQVDLLEMLTEINLDKVSATIERKPEPPTEPPGGIKAMLDDIRERQLLRHEQEQQDLKEWLEMPAGETWRDVQELLKRWSKRKYKNALFIELRARMEFPEWKGSWRCWLELVDEKGKAIQHTYKKASAHYVAEIMYNPDWRAVKKADNTTHFRLPVNNLIAEKKPRKPTRQQLAQAEKRARVTDGTLASILLDDPIETPEWMQIPDYPTGEELEPLPEEPTEPANDPSALINLLNTDQTINQLSFSFK